jgi:hypothetical protein
MNQIPFQCGSRFDHSKPVKGPWCRGQGLNRVGIRVCCGVTSNDSRGQRIHIRTGRRGQNLTNKRSYIDADTNETKVGW